MNTTPCKACGAPIIWATNILTGKTIPLDARTVVYSVHTHKDDDGVEHVACSKVTGGFPECGDDARILISHFATCPAAAQFSGKGKK